MRQATPPTAVLALAPVLASMVLGLHTPSARPLSDVDGAAALATAAAAAWSSSTVAMVPVPKTADDVGKTWVWETGGPWLVR